MQKPHFDHQLARSCAHAFYASTGLSCTVSDTEGTILFEEGVGFTRCPLCAPSGCSREQCTRSHIYGMLEAERFGGKYIYCCPMGLTCFVSPILGDTGTAAKITAGPFIMVEKQDFIDCELTDNLHLSGEQYAYAVAALEHIPFVSPDTASELSNLLFMAVGFMNNVSAENRLLEAGRSDALQGQIGAYIAQLKQKPASHIYPLDKERALLRCIARSEKPQAYQLLNELLGAIFLLGGGNLDVIKARGYELMVLMSRTAIENGADVDHTLAQCQQFPAAFANLLNFADICARMTDTMTRFMDSLFGFSDTKHANIIHRCIQHIGSNYAERLTLEDTAHTVFLSPAYLSRIFKTETGVTFNQYLNQVRITKARELMQNRELKLTDIALMVGYEDQSYFTRVFKRITGVSPTKYRNSVSRHPYT